MKYVKILGLVVVAAAALMVFIGASTASATVLCKTPGTGTPVGTTCPGNQAYPAGTEIHMISESNVVLTTGSEFTEITCKSGTLKGTLENEGSATETVKGDSASASDLSWGECSTPNGKCTVTTVAAGTLEVHWIEGSHNGTVTVSNLQVTSNCASIFGTIHCIFVPETGHFGVLTGGAPATLDIEEAPFKPVATSSLCPETPKLDAKYLVTTPNPLYVTGHT
jgi:hypothetical protein